MDCFACSRKFRDGDLVLAVLTYVTNEKRGDFVGSAPQGYIHMHHVEMQYTD